MVIKVGGRRFVMSYIKGRGKFPKHRLLCKIKMRSSEHSLISKTFSRCLCSYVCVSLKKMILILNGMKFFEQLVIRKLLLNFSSAVLRRWCWCWDPGGFKLKTSRKVDCLMLDLVSSNAVLEWCCKELGSMTDAEKVLETMSALRIGPDVVSLGHLDKAHAIVEVPESEKCCGADFLGGHERDGGDFGFVPRRLVSFSESCSTSMLRSTNGVLAAICSLMIFEILSPLRPALTLTLATSSSSSISFSGKSYERRWRLGSCYHFEEVLTSGSIFVLFINGHSYRGLFQNTDLLQFVPNQACAGVSMALLDSLEAEMPLSSTGQKSDGTGKHSTGFKADYSRIVWDLERLKALSAQLSRKKMIFAFDGMSFEVFLASGTISMHNFVDPLSAAASTMGGIPQFGHYYGDIFICSQCVIGNIIRIAGGMAVVLAIVEASMTNDMLHMALSLLACALHKKPKNLHDMQVYRGYHLLALLRRRVVFTLLLSLYPIHWFFTFLYYTDVASATAVLAMYLACLRRHYWLSAMFGSLGIFIRQTNLIWMLFSIGTGAIDYISLLTRRDISSDVGWWKKVHFDASDADGDGLLNITEFNEFLHPKNSKNPKLLRWLCTEEVREKDADKDGKLNFEEFDREIFYLIKGDEFGFNFSQPIDSQKAQADQLFSYLDLNNNGFLTEEFIPIIGKVYLSELDSAKQLVYSILLPQADKNKDGRLSLQEMMDDPYTFCSAINDEQKLILFEKKELTAYNVDIGGFNNTMGLENRAKIETWLRNLEGREIGRSAGSEKGKPKIEVYDKDRKMGAKAQSVLCMVLLLRNNKIKLLPTTMASMSDLRELDLSFNEVDSIPKSLCLATSLVKPNLGSNFADLKHVPRGIDNLEMLDELDISHCQIIIRPDFFARLSNLRVFRVDETPLEVPPLQIAVTGAQERVHYMAQLIANRDANARSNKLNLWARILLCSKKNEKKPDHLIMDNAELTGNVQKEIFSFPQIQQVTLSNNKFNGTLDLGQSTSSQLQLIDLQFNKISLITVGSVPSNDLQLFGITVCSRVPNLSYCQLPKPSNNGAYTTSLTNCGNK